MHTKSQKFFGSFFKKEQPFFFSVVNDSDPSANPCQAGAKS
jgi:hypothetical protein